MSKTSPEATGPPSDGSIRMLTIDFSIIMREKVACQYCINRFATATAPAQKHHTRSDRVTKRNNNNYQTDDDRDGAGLLLASFQSQMITNNLNWNKRRRSIRFCLTHNGYNKRVRVETSSQVSTKQIITINSIPQD